MLVKRSSGVVSRERNINALPKTENQERSREMSGIASHATQKSLVVGRKPLALPCLRLASHYQLRVLSFPSFPWGSSSSILPSRY
jgi:hypothetical protein